MIQVMNTGRSPTMRGLGNTHGVSINKLKETFDQSWNNLVKEDTTTMAGDIFTKAFENKDKWSHACRMINMYDMSDSSTAPFICGGSETTTATKSPTTTTKILPNETTTERKVTSPAMPAQQQMTSEGPKTQWITYYTPKRGETRVACPDSVNLFARLPPRFQWTGKRKRIGKLVAGNTKICEEDDWTIQPKRYAENG